MISAYLHIPFCEQLCYYCDFNKVFLEDQPVDEYIQAMLSEMDLMNEYYPQQQLETLYIGGGTPTSLSAKQLDVLLDGVFQRYQLSTNAEFTVEANPGDLTVDKMHVLENYGVNRLSMGVQSFDDRLLKKIGRKHSAKEVYQTMKIIEKSSIDNVTIDLMYALPGQTVKMFLDSVDQALALGLPHLSMYALILENKTMFANLARRGQLLLPTDDEEVAMFELAKERLAKAGLFQYEISNFAKKGFESQHNLMYWNNEHYFGFGAGASGYLGHWRYRNQGPIQHYMAAIHEGKLPLLEEEHLTEDNQMEEHLFLGLRKMEGVTYQGFQNQFQQSLLSVYGEEIEGLVQRGLLLKDENGIRLNDKGILFGNDVFSEFLLDE